MADRSSLKWFGILDPIERISEVIYGVIMTLTFTCTFAVGTADNMKTRTMLLGALGCNLAWGIIDAWVYLLTRLNIEGRRNVALSAILTAPDATIVRQFIAETLHPAVASSLSEKQLDLTTRALHEASLGERSRLKSRDGLGALAVFLICFSTTFPIAAPFLIIRDPRLALRVSNVIAVIMLFLCGYAFGYRSGLRPVLTALSMVVFGATMIAIAIALGG